MARAFALAAAFAVCLLAVSGASGSGAQSPRVGGTVVFGGPFGEPACLSPLRDECAPGSTGLTLGFIGSKVLEAPFDVGPELTWRPRLVSRVTFTTRPPITLTYHIRPEARWSDGVPITAADFVFTHRALLGSRREEDAHRNKVRSVRALDSKTVEVILRSRLAGWRELFGSILPRHALAGVDLAHVWTDGIDNPKTGAPIGSGPFLVERWERGKQITLRRNPRYWGPHPAYLDRLVVRFQVQGTALREAFRRGDLDAASHFPPGFVPELQQESALRVLSNARAAGWDHFEIRMRGPGGHPALSNVLVRRALAYGIDRGAIAEQFLRTTDRSASQLDSAVFPTRSRHYRKNWEGYRYRPAEARRLLEQAGCRRGADGIYVCAGSRLSLRFVTTFLVGGFRPRVIELAATQLRAAGVEVVPTYAPSNAIFGQILTSGNFDVALFSWISTPGASATKSIFGCGGEDNYTGYCQRLVTANLDQAERILDADRQAQILNRTDMQIARDVPVIPLYQQTQSVAIRSTLRNFGLSLNTQFAPLWNAENWWLAEGR